MEQFALKADMSCTLTLRANENESLLLADSSSVCFYVLKCKSYVKLTLSCCPKKQFESCERLCRVKAVCHYFTTSVKT